ncbi:hypothetical protein Tco_0432391 [Tanacetum coccineum]
MYQVDKIQSTRFEVSDPGHNKGETSLEVEPHTQPPILTFQDFEFLMKDSEDDLKELSDEEVYEARDEMEDTFLLNTKPESSKSVKKKAKKSKESESSSYPPDSESSSAFLSFKPYDNYMHVAKDNWEKHEEDAASYADLKWEVKDFHKTTLRATSNTDAHIRNFEKIPHQDKAQHVKGINIILTNLKEVQDAVKDDPAMNGKVFEATNIYVQNSSKLTELNLIIKEVVNTYRQSSTNLINLTELIWETNILGLRNTLEAIQNNVNAHAAHHDTLENSYRSLALHVGPRLTKIELNQSKEEKVTKEEPQATQPEPIQTVIPTTPYPTTLITPEAQVTEIDGKIVQIPNDQLHAYLDKKEYIDQAMKEAKLMRSLKKKAKMRKKRLHLYVWTTNNRLKPDRITDIFIHPNTRPVAVTIYRYNDQRNFEVYRNFKFSDFCISEWDELSIIIPKKKNKVVSELMTSLSNKCERLKRIPNELGLNLVLQLPEQDPSLPRRKRKSIELEPETYIVGLHYYRILHEGVTFVKNLVIEEPDHGLFFIDAFGEPTFQRMDDIHKVETDTLLG